MQSFAADDFITSLLLQSPFALSDPTEIKIPLLPSHADLSALNTLVMG